MDWELRDLISYTYCTAAKRPMPGGTTYLPLEYLELPRNFLLRPASSLLHLYIRPHDRLYVPAISARCCHKTIVIARENKGNILWITAVRRGFDGIVEGRIRYDGSHSIALLLVRNGSTTEFMLLTCGVLRRYVSFPYISSDPSEDGWQ